MRLRGPIHIEKTFKVDLLDSLFLLRPWYVTALHLDLHAHLDCRRNLSTYAHALLNVCHEEAEDKQALDWRPRLVGFDI